MKKKSLAILHIPRPEGQRGQAQEEQRPVGRRDRLEQAQLWPAVEEALRGVSGQQWAQLQVETETVVVEGKVEQPF